MHFSAFYPTFCSFILHFLQFSQMLFRYNGHTSAPKRCFKRCADCSVCRSFRQHLPLLFDMQAALVCFPHFASSRPIICTSKTDSRCSPCSRSFTSSASHFSIAHFSPYSKRGTCPRVLPSLWQTRQQRLLTAQLTAAAPIRSRISISVFSEKACNHYKPELFGLHFFQHSHFHF